MQIFKIIFTVTVATVLVSCGTETKKESEKVSEGKPDSVLLSIRDTVTRDPFKDGEEIIKYNNGVIKMRGTYKNGKREGTWLSWYDTGKPWSENFFEGGLKNGKTITYYENGQIRYEGHFKNDKKDGHWKYYNEAGKLVKEELLEEK